MALLDCTLVHHTGTMIRFVTSQLPSLPTADQDVWVALPNGRAVRGRFHLHPANPYVGGPDVVSYIKGILDFGQNSRMLIDISPGGTWTLYSVDDAGHVASRAGVGLEELAPDQFSMSNLEQLLQMADSEAAAGARRRVYQQVLRPPGPTPPICSPRSPDYGRRGFQGSQEQRRKTVRRLPHPTLGARSLGAAGRTWADAGGIWYAAE